MSVVIETSARANHGRHTDRAAQIVAAWAAAEDFGSDHVVYEGPSGWHFAATPRATVELRKGSITTAFATGESTTTAWTDDASAAIAAALDALPFDEWQVFGWVGFDYCAAHHDLLDRVADDAVLAVLMVPQTHVILDPRGLAPDGGFRAGAVRVVATPDSMEATELVARLAELADGAVDPAAARPVDVSSDVDDYRGRVATAIDEITRGEYQKVIMSRRVDVPFTVDMPATYARGRANNNPARSFLVSMDGMSAAGFSPELVVATSADGEVVTEPLAGTRALGVSDEEDRAAAAELRSDAKEIAEHAMSVAACFDEVAQVSLPGTTAVNEFMAIRERGSVQHLASTVRGELAPDAGPWRALAVIFPSITASGIPKQPALDAIYRLEPDERGLYSGAVLTASSDGAMEATLTLRTVFTTQGHSWLRAGAGIVEQSTPEREFTETVEKLSSVAPFVVPAPEDRQ